MDGGDKEREGGMDDEEVKEEDRTPLGRLITGSDHTL